MRIRDFIRVHYAQCLKDYFYIGISLVFLAIFLRISFWGLYTTETSDIDYDEDLLVYPQLKPGEDVRIHGEISEIKYYDEVETDLAPRSEISDANVNLSSAVYLHGLRVMDNVTWEKILFHNITLRNLLIYDGDFSNVIFENMAFENVSFIKSTFSRICFENVRFDNISFIDCSIRRSLFRNVELTKGYTRELEFSRSVIDGATFDLMAFSRTEFEHIDWNNGQFRNTVFNDTEFRGIRFENNAWTQCAFNNSIFDIVIFNSNTLDRCNFQRTSFRNILIDHAEKFEYTYIRSHYTYIRVKGDIRNSFTEGTSIYGSYRIRRDEGNLSQESGESIEFAYEIFEDGGTHHSLRIDGIFYVIILGGFTVITYSYGGKTVIMALVKFFLPFVLSGIGIIIFFLTLPWDTFEKLGTWMILYFFPPLGKESVIPAAIAQGIHPLLIASAIAFIDIMVGLFLVWNFDLARKIPLIGNFIRRIESKGNDILAKKPWVERLAFTGIILFVMFPFQGSGAVGATIVGRMLGMDQKKVWYAVIIGAIVGCLIIAYTSAFAMTFLLGIGIAYALLTVLLVIIFLILVYYYDKWGDWVRERL